MKSLDILFLSSKPPYHSAGLADDMMNALGEAGHNVEFLTLYDFAGRGENQYFVISNKPSLWYRIQRKLIHFYKRLVYGKLLSSTYIYNNDLIITNPIETLPPLPTGLLLSKIKKKYDLVVTLFWQDMLTAYSLMKVYEKLHCPIIISSVDMFTYTGGCYFFLYCRNFEKQCGCCPALNSNNPNDITHRNFLTKKRVYETINYAIGLNTWMQSFAKRTCLFDERRIISTSAVIDEGKFVVLDKKVSREKLQLPCNKRFMLLARYSGDNHEGKGFSYLVDAVNIFYRGLTVTERSNVMLVIIGEDFNNDDNIIEIPIHNAGFLSTDNLIYAYNACDLFLSPSIDDAGPSMVNQSIMCGTPVVSFNVGTAIDVIENGKSGYRVENKNSKAFSQAILNVFKMKNSTYESLRRSTREIALKYNSKQSFVRMIENTYSQLAQKLV